jgi:hypothetical protein
MTFIGYPDVENNAQKIWTELNHGLFRWESGDISEVFVNWASKIFLYNSFSIGEIDLRES